MGTLLERPAFGQRVRLGALYNAHTDTFSDSSLFVGSLPPDAIQTTIPRLIIPATAISHADSFQERCDLMGVNQELAASLLSGLAPAGGSGKCLQDESNFVQEDDAAEGHYGAFSYRLITAQDHLLPEHEGLHRQIPFHGLEYTQATHVVTGISWGCHAVIVARSASGSEDMKDGDEYTGVPGQISAADAMTKFKSAVDGLQHDTTRNLNSLHLQNTKLDISAYSETFESNGILLESLDEAFEFIKLLPSVSKHTGVGHGNGDPVAYSLLPIKTLLSLLGHRVTEGPEAGLFSFPPHFLSHAVARFEHVESESQRLFRYVSHLITHKAYVPTDMLERVEKGMYSIHRQYTQLKKSFAKVLKTGRMDGPSEAPMTSVIEDIEGLWGYCGQLLNMEAESQAKINFAKNAVENGAIYVGYNGIRLHDLLTFCSGQQKRETYVFGYSQGAMDANEPSWNENHTLLFQLLRQDTSLENQNNPRPAIIVLDTDATPATQDRAQITHRNEEGQVVTHDLYQMRQFEDGHSFARFDTDQLEYGDDVQKPVQRRKAKMPCPGWGCDKLEACHWICSKCNSTIEFGFTDDYFYCDCGRAKVCAWTFRCQSPNHNKGTGDGRMLTRKRKSCSSNNYVSYTNWKQLLSTLRRLDQTDFVNILILGETGVGKSTFINSLFNYLSFSTLDDAKYAEELNWIIPCSFSIQTMDRSNPNGAIKESKVHVGSFGAEEDDGSKGVSATQQTNVYTINEGTKTIRLIDTPGIGDTRGVAYDKENLADILRTLNSYDKLHGILILLKSNNSRLTATFNFCMQELLTHLHYSAAQNMAFGFTNTRISNYSPGDTFGPLTTLLEKHKEKIGLALENQNTFCFDSESFRFLAALKNGIAMENEDDFRRSWDHSRKEATRLVQFFESKIPHNVKSTLNLNGTRQLIAELVKPMTDISNTIVTNIQVLQDYMQEFNDTQLSGERLQQRLQVPKVHLRTIPLDRPRTVCRNANCVTWRDNGTGTVMPIYKKPCHSPCYLKNIAVDQVSCPGLVECRAFRKGNVCRVRECGHSWQEHMHVCFELQEYTAMVSDAEAERLLHENKSSILVKELAIKNLNQTVFEYKEEHRQIKEAAARFGIFLKKHSITPYNDATLGYLDMLIKEEEQKSCVSRDTTKLDRLRQDRNEHIELVKVLEESIDNDGDDKNGGQLDMADVEAAVQNLYQLKHFGDNLQHLKEGMTEAYQASYRERPCKVSHSPRHRSPCWLSQEKQSGWSRKNDNNVLWKRSERIPGHFYERHGDRRRFRPRTHGMFTFRGMSETMSNITKSNWF